MINYIQLSIKIDSQSNKKMNRYEILMRMSVSIDWLLFHFPALEEEFEEIKRVIRIRKSKQDRQHNGQMKKDKSINKDIKKTLRKKIKIE